MRISLKNSLQKIGETQTAKYRLILPDLFDSMPQSSNFRNPASLKQAVYAMHSPEPQGKVSEGEYRDNWTRNSQGVTNDGNFWYFSSNKKRYAGGIVQTEKRGIYKFSKDMRKQLAFFGVDDPWNIDHIGGIDHYRGIIYTAIEAPEDRVHPPGILTVSTRFNRSTAKLTELNGPQGNSIPWCAINPWNGLLYSSEFGDIGKDKDKPPVQTIYAYDPNDNFRYIKSKNITLSKTIRRVQGGCFSENGHLILSSDHSKDIRYYSALNGFYLGRSSIQSKDGEEVEGVSIWKNYIHKNKKSHVHVILWEKASWKRVTFWDAGDTKIWFKHYSVKHPEYL